MKKLSITRISEYASIGGFLLSAWAHRVWLWGIIQKGLEAIKTGNEATMLKIGSLIIFVISTSVYLYEKYREFMLKSDDLTEALQEWKTATPADMERLADALAHTVDAVNLDIEKK